MMMMMMMMMILTLEIIYMVLQSGRIITYTRDKTFFYGRVSFMIYTHNTAIDYDDNDDTYRMNKKNSPP